MQVRRILVPTDFSRNAQLAFNAAYHLARTIGATIDLLHVQGESNVRAAIKENLFRTQSSTASLREAVEELQEVRFSEVTAGYGNDVTVRCITAYGTPQNIIAEYARENDSDLMVVGLRGSGSVDRIRSSLLGSVAEAMIRISPCPVLVVRPDHAIEPPRGLYA